MRHRGCSAPQRSLGRPILSQDAASRAGSASCSTPARKRCRPKRIVWCGSPAGARCPELRRQRRFMRVIAAPSPGSDRSSVSRLTARVGLPVTCVERRQVSASAAGRCARPPRPAGSLHWSPGRHAPYSRATRVLCPRFPGGRCWIRTSPEDFPTRCNAPKCLLTRYFTTRHCSFLLTSSQRVTES